MPTHLSTVPALPAYRSHHGRRVEWEHWRHTIAVSCVPAEPCLGCGEVHPTYTSWGTVHPLPGQTRPTGKHERVRTASGRRRRVATHEPARPLRELVAFVCAACHHLNLYEVGDSFNTFTRLE